MPAKQKTTNETPKQETAMTTPEVEAEKAKQQEELAKPAEEVTTDHEPNDEAIDTEVVQTRYAKVADIRDFYVNGAYSPQQVADHFNVDLKDVLRVLGLDQDEPQPIQGDELKRAFS